MAILQYAVCPQLADSRRSGDEIYPWLPNGDLRPFAATHGVLAEGPLIR